LCATSTIHRIFGKSSIHTHFPSSSCSCVFDYRYTLTFLRPVVHLCLNYRNGRWRSEWTLKLAGSQLQGLMRCSVHYYEDGNVQLNTDKDASSTISSSGVL
jgi:capping protein alpha